MTEDPDRRRPLAPHCYRVVHLGISIRAEAAPALADRVAGPVQRRGERITASAIYEPKVGGGGHLLLIEDGAATPWVRLLVEPDGATVNINAAIFENDWEASDDALVLEVRDWLRALHGIHAHAEDAGSLSQPSNGSGSHPMG